MGEPRRRDEDDGDGRATEQLQEARGDLTVEQRAHVALEAAGLAVAEQVVDEPEQAEGDDREEHLAALDGEVGRLADPERTEARPPGLDDDDREHDQDSATGRQHVAAVVRPGQRGRAHHPACTDTEQLHGERPDDEAEDDGHVRLAARSGASARTGGGRSGSVRTSNHTKRRDRDHDHDAGDRDPRVVQRPSEEPDDREADPGDLHLGYRGDDEPRGDSALGARATTRG